MRPERLVRKRSSCEQATAAKPERALGSDDKVPVFDDLADAVRHLLDREPVNGIDSNDECGQIRLVQRAVSAQRRGYSHRS